MFAPSAARCRPPVAAFGRTPPVWTHPLIGQPSTDVPAPENFSAQIVKIGPNALQKTRMN